MSQPHASSLAREGEVIAGKYRVERILGSGGMGVVVAARHMQLDERVALKFLLPNAGVNADIVARFIREARAAAKIKNEHVARVTDVGELENGSPYMVMEYLEGSDLAQWLVQRGALPVEQAVDFVLQACEALAEAHALGIVHRDLKPANLFCLQKADGNLCIKVLDFGISKITSPDGPSDSMTKTSAFLGSPLYMSPEQMERSKGVDARTDVWSLGIILFELLTGKPPFDAEAMTELVIKIATHPAMRVRSLRSDAPEELEQVVSRCLEKDRARRFQTVGELAQALLPFASARGRISVEGVVGTLQRAGMSGMSTQARAVAASSPALATSAPRQTDASWGQTAPGRSAGGKIAAAIGVALTLAVLGVGGTFVFHRLAPPANALTTTATAAAPPEPAVAASAPSVTTAASAAPEPAPSTGAAPSVSAAPASTAPKPRAAQAPKPSTPSPSKPTAASPAAGAAPDCNPRYYYDANGGKHYKPECFGK